VGLTEGLNGRSYSVIFSARIWPEQGEPAAHHKLHSPKKSAKIDLNLNRFSISGVLFAYQLRPRVTLNIDVNNLFNEPVSWYRGVPDQMERTIITGTTLTFGVSGRF
jgi:hypothetical protein